MGELIVVVVGGLLITTINSGILLILIAALLWQGREFRRSLESSRGGCDSEDAGGVDYLEN